MTTEGAKLFQLDDVTCTGKVMGKGAYGRVTEVSVLCAAKEIHHTLVDYSNSQEFVTLKQKFLQECEQCSVLCHPNIVHFQGIYYPSKNAQLPWLVMEKMDCSLKQYLENNEPTAVSFQIKMSILHDVSLGLQYLHAQDIIHRDLSSNNVLLDKQLVAKIADLGVAKALDSKHAKSATQAPGTVIFMPPEALSFQPRYGKPVDVFSFGCVTIHVMTHIWPIPKDEAQYDEVTGKKLAFTEVERRDHYLANIQWPVQLKELILQCLQDLPKYRPSVNDICKVLGKLQPDLKVSKIQSILLDYEPLLVVNEDLTESNKMLTEELQRLNNELAASNNTINHLHQEAEQQAEKYQRDLCKTKEEIKVQETMYKESVEQEHKNYENQLQIMRNEIHQLQAQCKELQKSLESRTAVCKSQTSAVENITGDSFEKTVQSDNLAIPKPRNYVMLVDKDDYSPVDEAVRDVSKEPQGIVQVNNLVDIEHKDNLTSKNCWDSIDDLNKSCDSDDVDDPDMFIAKYDFTPIGPGQLALSKGDRVIVLGKNDVGDWCEGKTESGDIGWVPTSYIAKLSSIEKHSWYHGLVSREEAETRLNSGINGSFLIRESETRLGQYSISLRFEGSAYHYRISNDGKGYYVRSDAKFKTLSLLVHHHSSHSDGLMTTLHCPAKPPIHLSSEIHKWEVGVSDLEMGAKLATGQYGEVYKAVFKPMGMTVAVKVFKRNIISAKEFLKEVPVMKLVKHPNLVQLLGICTQQMPYFIIMEFMEKGNLLIFIRGPEGASFRPVKLAHMGQQIASGMAYLEKSNIIHRDLAAHSCLVGENHLVKVADFRRSRLLEKESYDARTLIKFPIKWTAPEALEYNKFSIKSDVWSFGILLWELMTHGKSPYPNAKLSQVYEMLENGYRLECPDGCPEQIYSMMKKCWTWEENTRPTFKALHQELCQLSSIKEDELSKSQALTASNGPDQPEITQQVPHVSKKTTEPKIKSKRSASLIPQNGGNAPYKLRETRHNSDTVVRQDARALQDKNDFSSVQPISHDPDCVIAEMTRVSANLLDISFKGLSFFKRSLEYFVRLSEKMLHLHLTQAQNTSHFASVIGKLEEKIRDFRDLLAQINSNLPYNLNVLIETSVKDITESCKDLYDKMHSNK